MSTARRTFFGGALFVAVVLGMIAGLAQGPADPVLRGFQDPPSSARPRVWWHWMNGNITKDGIRADLEWMKRVGLGGVQNFDAALMTPAVVDKRLVFMTPEWKDAFKSAVALADRLGLEFAIAGSPGWSESGGPWVPPEQAMKKLVWTETRVEGGRPFTSPLARPSSAPGPFQNAPNLGAFGGPPFKAPEFYRDVAVLAWPMPADDRSMADLAPAFSIGGARIDAARIADGDFTTTVSLPAAPAGHTASLDIDLGKPQTIYALSLGTTNTNPMAMFQGTTDDGPQLLASGDGGRYGPVARVPRGRLPQYTVSFPGVRARYFRVAFETPAPERIAEGIDIPGLDLRMPAPREILITEIALSTAPRVHRFEDKAGFAPTPGLGGLDTPRAAAEQAIATDGVIDLTSKMRPDGTLDWTPPAGRWAVLRLGHSLTGKENSPASPEATGLEVDKMSAAAVDAYFTRYLDMYRDASGGLMGARGIGFVITDSWEAGVANWTDDMIAEFTKRRGYDLRPWLPALTGRIVRSAEATDRFLNDYRATIAELTVANHYDKLTAMLRERGMARYSESHEDRRAMIADGMEVKRTAGIPMSAMWTGRGGPLGVPPQFAADIRESASVAHIYGQNIVAAESLTAGGGAYTFSPETLKPTADAELSQGLNRFVIHTSVHQPLEKKPGLGLGPFGQWFTRHETWAEEAGPWVTYLARSSFMLQQGRFVADVLYYYGDDSNITALFGEKGPEIPAGYSFDYANSDVLLNRLAVSNGSLTTTTGMTYRVLALDANARLMQLPVLRRLRDLVRAGAIVAGRRPFRSPRLMDDEEEFAAIADELWGPGGGPKAVGAGKVYGDPALASVLAAEKIAPDFEHSKPQADTALLFVHRALADGELYWVNNRQKRAESVEATFRVTGRAPELWHPDTGVVEPASYRVANGRTIVPLRLDPDDAVFVVFRKSASAPSRAVPVPIMRTLASIDGPWTVAFQAGRGAPASATFAALAPWNEHADPGIKYFSGTAIYRKTIDAPPAWSARGVEVWLELGDVKHLARVTVNGTVLPTVWKPPFRVNVTTTLRAGANRVEIAVTNLWVNRVIGDQQPDAKEKFTYTPMPFYRATSPLLPSGLLGPVQVVRESSR
jgi:hypothetical protein